MQRPLTPRGVSSRRVGRALLGRTATGGVALVLAAMLVGLPQAARTEVTVAAAGDPVIAAAGDIACDPSNTHFNNGLGTSGSCRQLHTSDLLVNAGLAAVLDLGDNQYYCGGYDAFLASYDKSWGRLKSITKPAVGNHEYLTSGGTGCDASNTAAAGHFKYFGAAAGDPTKGYYSYDIGTWHIIMLNSTCSGAGGCSSTSPQGKFLRDDLASHRNQCTLAYWHVPLFSSGGRADATYKTFWDALYAADADVVLNGHDHIYERFLPQTPTGTRDDARGLRQFIVGTGGANHTSIVSAAANSAVRNSDTYGVLKLTLHPATYDWEFVPEAGKSFRDVGTGSCHGPIPDTSSPTTPTAVTAAAVGGTRVDLSWNPGTDDVGVSGYSVQRNGVEVAFVSGTSYRDAGLAPNTGYSYRIVARDHAGNLSPPSATVTATTGPPDEVLTFAPTDDAFIESDRASTNFGSATELVVDASPVRDLLLRFAPSGIAGRPVLDARLKLQGVDPASNGGVFRRTGASWSEATVTWQSAPAADPSTIGSIGSVVAGTTYELPLTSVVVGDGSFALRASSTSTNSAQYASKERGTALAPKLVVTVPAASTDTVPPTAPTNVSATASSSTVVDVRWSASTDDVGIAGYRIVRDGVQVGTVDGALVTYHDTGRTPATSYSYTVEAVDAAGNRSPRSDPATATTPPDTTPPEMPANLTASASGPTRVDLRWDASSDDVGVTAYTVYRGGTFLATVLPTGTTYSDTTVAPATGYSYTVDAVDGAANHSPPSRAAPVITPAVSLLFADDFETGGLSRWTSNVGLAASSAPVYSGSWAARASSAGATPAYAYKQLATAQSDLYYRVRFRVASTLKSNVTVIKFRTGTGTSMLGMYLTSTGRLGYRNDVAAVSVVSTTTPSLAAWHELQVHLRINGASSRVETWLDGVAVATLSRTDNLGTTPIGRIQLGDSATDRSAYDVSFDTVAVDTRFIE